MATQEPRGKMNMDNLSETQKAEQQILSLQNQILAELKTHEPDLELCLSNSEKVLSIQNRKYCGMMIGLANI